MLKKLFPESDFIRLEGLFSSKVAGLILIIVIILMVFSAFLIQVSYEASECAEFQNLAFAMLMGRGENPYQSMYTTMTPIGCYGSLSYFVPALIGRILKTVYSPYLFLLTFRFIVISYFLGYLFLLCLIFKKITANLNYTLLLLIAVAYPTGWQIGVRPDWQALFYM